MERLNDILGRTPQRRQPHSDQRARSGEPGSGQRSRAPQSQPAPVRRPSAEQLAYLRQRYAPQNGQGRNQQGQGLGRGQQGQNPGPSHDPRRTRNIHQEQPEQPEQQEQMDSGAYESSSYHRTDSRPTYSSYDESDARRSIIDNASLSRQPKPPYHKGPSLNASPTPDYNNEYYPDDYTFQPDADVLGDDFGLMNGDWEGGRDVSVYGDEHIEIFEEPPDETPRRYSSSTYHSPAPETDPGLQRTRRLRDMRPSASYRQQPQVPPRTQEVPHHQRITQPLNQQSVANISRPREQAQSQRTLRSQRQSAPKETPVLPLLPSTPTTYAPLTNNRPICPKCKGAGYLRSNVPFGHPNFGKPIACDCKETERKERRRQQLRDLSNMDAFRGHTFRTFNSRAPGVQEAYDAALSFAENPEGWLILVGPNGCGKTHLAAAIANQSLEDGAVVLFEAVPDLLDHLRAAFAPTATEVYDQLFSKMREAELLVLDDLGAQQSSPWANEKLFQLLNYRYNMRMPTVITANSRVMQGVDERIRSRVGDVSVVRNITMDRARDYRPTNPKRR